MYSKNGGLNLIIKLVSASGTRSSSKWSQQSLAQGAGPTVKTFTDGRVDNTPRRRKHEYTQFFRLLKTMDVVVTRRTLGLDGSCDHGSGKR